MHVVAMDLALLWFGHQGVRCSWSILGLPASEAAAALVGGLTTEDDLDQKAMACYQC